MEALISVVIPIFNRPKELARALNSLVAQDFHNFEVIVVDDGSTIDLSVVISQYTELLQLTYIKISNSGGPARPRNIGMQHAQSKWIAFLDSDDWWSSIKIREVTNAINSFPDNDLFYHKLKIISNSLGQKWWLTRSLGGNIAGDPFLSLMLNGNSIPNSSAVFKRSCYLKHGMLNEAINYQSVEDFDYWLTLAYNGCKFIFIPKVLGYYSLEGEGISSNFRKTIIRNKLLLNKYINFLDVDKKSSALSRYHYFAGSVLYSTGLPAKAYSYMLRADSLNQINFRLKRLYKLIRIYFQLKL
jgi:glycosyltransferase involved in cell wall biosynthesis